MNYFNRILFIHIVLKPIVLRLSFVTRGAEKSLKLRFVETTKGFRIKKSKKKLIHLISFLVVCETNLSD